QSLFNVIGGALLSGYGREHELESDRLGAEYLARAGYDPRAMLGVLEVLKNQEEYEKARAEAEGREPRIYHGVYATHPSADTRLQETGAQAEQYKTGAEPRVGREVFLAHIDGMVFGDSARAGVRRGSAFYHRELDVALAFPAGWRIENTARAVIARAPGNDALLELRADPLDKHMPPEAWLARLLGRTRLRAGAPVPGT